jgi:hypothetical protein
MLSKNIFSFILLTLCFGSINAHAVIDRNGLDGITKYTLAKNPATLTVYILKNSTRADQIGAVIQSLNKTFNDTFFSSNCSAAMKVVPNSYSALPSPYDSTAYGALTVQVSHNCFPALNMVLTDLGNNPHILVRIPVAISPAVTISN